MPVARYAVTFGLRGCYMPDSHAEAFEVHSRRELASLIREELRTYDLPACLFRGVRIRRLWGFIRRYGSSTAHFGLHHGAYALEFHGLTEGEYPQQTGDE